MKLVNKKQNKNKPTLKVEIFAELSTAQTKHEKCF